VAERLVIGSRVRSWLQDPYMILSSLGLSRGHVFLDIGCGTGFLTLPASTVVGDEGVVYAVDVDERYLEEVRRKAARYGVRNVKVVMTPAERLDGLPPKSVDRAVMMFSLHHVGDRVEAFRRVRDVLKYDGLLYIHDPISSRMLGHGTDPAKVLRELVEAGFEPRKIRRGFLFWRVLASPT
jgi:ubiquinone/menaquinone biosynthesis C-methylase UbiE